MYADAPFGVHVNPGVQFNALAGHLPNISLDVVKVRITEAYGTIKKLTRSPPHVGQCGRPAVS